MSLPRSPLSRLLGRNWWDCWDYPEHLMDQEFGTGLRDTDFLHHHHHRGRRGHHGFGHPQQHHERHVSCPSFACRTRRPGDGVSKVISRDDHFQIFLDVRQFQPDEIQVKTVDDSVVVHCKHDERLDEHGFVSREFTRRYVLPEGVQPEDVVSALSVSEGILTIEAPRRKPEPEAGQVRIIPIHMHDSSPEDAAPPEEQEQDGADKLGEK